MASVYIHIPFCQSRCIYCDFYSTTHIAQQQQYVDCLIREMEGRKEEWNSRARTLSIYMGGGTPSTLPSDLLIRLFDATTRLFPPAPDAEITIEANPDDITPQWIETLKQTPVNRISMGVQTFHDDALAFLRRRHSSRQATEAVRLLREAGYTNISIDLIYGLPGVSLQQWQQDVEQTIRLNVPHLSAYSLMYEEGTALTRLLEEGKIKEMDDDESWKCYELLCNKLYEAGYEHYEISNFAKPGFHSRHNSGYWQGTPYLGFGAGAHSYDGKNTRRGNLPSLQNYIKALSIAQPGTCGESALHADAYFESEHLTPTDLYNEFVMTRLRTSNGFSTQMLEERFGQEALQHCLRTIKPHLQQGNLVQTGSQICLSRKGVFISNEIISDLFMDEK